jgi:purine-binding chemotaxis protein CheW
MRHDSPNSKSVEKRNADQRRAASIDWTQIHQRLESVHQALESGTSRSPEAIQSVLRTRAKLLAQEPEGNKKPVGSLEIVEFLLAQEHYAIDSKYISEIQQLRDLTPIPCTPACVLGVMNARGKILWVIDIKKFFDLPEKGLTDSKKVIVVQTEGMELGILADEALGVRSITLGDLQPSLPTFTGVRAKCLRAVTKDSVAVLDVEGLLSDGGIVVNEESRTNNRGMS